MSEKRSDDSHFDVLKEVDFPQLLVLKLKEFLVLLQSEDNKSVTRCQARCDVDKMFQTPCVHKNFAKDLELSEIFPIFAR